MKLIKTLSLLALATSIAYGCGGSGGGSVASPNGIYSGNITEGQTSFNSDILNEEKAIIYNEGSVRNSVSFLYNSK